MSDFFAAAMNDFKLLVLNFLLRILFKFRSHSRGLREQPDEKQLCLSVIVQNETVGISALGSSLSSLARQGNKLLPLSV